MASCLEWYDFSIFIYIMPIVSELFIPESDERVAIVYAFGLLASGYLMRPLGGIFWGHLGDTIGRKKVLIYCILLMSIPMLVVAFLPTYERIGIFSVLILIAVRLLQGFVVGGDSGVLVLLLEQAGESNRGFVTSWFALVGTFGTFLSALTITILSILLTEGQMLSWGWRVPFFIGVFVALFALSMRRNIKESTHFERLRKDDKLSSSPILDAIKLYPGKLLVVVMLAGYIGIIYYVVTAFFPTYLQIYINLSQTEAMIITSLLIVVLALTSPFWGYLSDRVGRRPIMATSAILFIVLSYPMFWVMNNANVVMVFVAELILALPVMAFTAACGTFINELFPTKQRFSGTSTGYNIGVAVFGGTAPLVSAGFVNVTGDNLSPSFYLIAASIVTLIILSSTKETADQPLK